MRRFQDAARRRFSAQERRQLVVRWRKSNLTQAEFARQCGLKLTTLRQWLYRPHPRKVAERRVRFQELTQAAAPWALGSAVEIAVGAEITLRLNGALRPEFIAPLVHHLRQSC